MSSNAPTYNDFLLLHEPQLKLSGVAPLYWPALCHKLQNETWDLADRIALNRVVTVDGETDEETLTPSSPRVFARQVILADDPASIFLIDHAWTFELPKARQTLLSHPNLLARMSDIVDLPANAAASLEGIVAEVLERMWKFVNTYSVNSPCLDVEQKLPRWYMMDEIGSRVRHSETPNSRIVPFYYIPDDVTYSLLFPVNNILVDDEITRNYVEHVYSNDPFTRHCRLLPWVEYQLPDVGYEPREIRAEYFGSSKLADSLPSGETSPSGPANLKEKGTLKVFSEYDVLSQFLTDKRFELVAVQADADTLWYNRHFYDFLALSTEFPEKFVNQFPYESVLTVKDLFAIVSRRAVPNGQPVIDQESLESRPVWLPTTFNLDTELPNFVAYFRAREDRCLDNLWICKPWNLARSLDITITDNLNCILREPETGPKLCSKYIENPVLFHRDDVSDGPVKFDIRFIALLKRTRPLTVAIYKRFWLRFANVTFTLDDFEVYDKHFTVMNYGEAPIHQIYCDSFVETFGKQYPTQSWKEVEKDIQNIVREVFVAAVSKAPPEGIASSGQSRAVYGLDFMLKWVESNGVFAESFSVENWIVCAGTRTIQPMLLEVNYSPDCKRACEYYPEFYNEIFGYLFLDEPQETVTEL